MAISWSLGLSLLSIFGSVGATTLGQPVELLDVENEVHLCLINPNPRTTLPPELQFAVSPDHRSSKFYFVNLQRKSQHCYKLEPADLLRGKLSAVLHLGGSAGTGKIHLRLAIRCNPELDSCLMFMAEKFYSTQSKEDYEELLELRRRAAED
jgi:hypothetical protein